MSVKVMIPGFNPRTTDSGSPGIGCKDLHFKQASPCDSSVWFESCCPEEPFEHMDSGHVLGCSTNWKQPSQTPVGTGKLNHGMTT